MCDEGGCVNVVSVKTPIDVIRPPWPRQLCVSGISRRERPWLTRTMAKYGRVSENLRRKYRSVFSATSLRRGRNQGCLRAFPERPASRGGSPRMPGDSRYFEPKCMAGRPRFFFWRVHAAFFFIFFCAVSFFFECLFFVLLFYRRIVPLLLHLCFL